MHEAGTPSGEKIRVALFGAGKMAMHHLKAIRLQENAKLDAVADPAVNDEERSILVEEGIIIYTSPEDLLEKERPDVVHICTPPATHERLARLALQYGAHIYVEKPFTLHANEAIEIIALAKEKDLQVCAGHQLLYESPTLRADNCLKKIGRITHVESYFSFNPVRRSKDGRTAISPLEQLVDILPHPVYLLLHFLKKNFIHEEVSTDIRALEVNTSGSVHAIVRSGDVTGCLIVTLVGRPIESYIKVVGTNGCLYADFVRGAMITIPGPGVSAISKILHPYRQSWQMFSETTRALFRRVFKKQKSYPGLLEIICSFYESIRSGGPPPISYASITETVSLCEEAGKKLKIEEMEEYLIDEEKLARLESELTPIDQTQSGVLVTGGTGLLGSAVASTLRKGNRFTRVVSRKTPTFSSRVPGVEYVAADLAEEDFPPDIFKDISIVVHCAAETAGGRKAHERNSVDATRNLLQMMYKNGVKKLIHISSIAVLKTSKEMGGSVDENTPLSLYNEERGPYVWGKAESERLAREEGKELGISVRVIRPGPLVTYKDFEPPGRLGREIGPLFVMIGSKRSKLDLCTTETAAEVIRKYVERFETMPPVLNLVEPDSPTRAELVSRLLRSRPDLKVLRLPSGFLWVFSPILKVVQLFLRPNRKPLDIYAAFASEDYDSGLAVKVIQS